MRIILVGEDFGNSDPLYHRDLYALTGKSGRRLAELCGYEGEGTSPVLQLCQDFERTNVVTLATDWRDPGKVDAGTARVLRRVVERPDARLVLLGSRVARALRVEDHQLFEASRVESTRFGATVAFAFVRAPHPSGRSHWWNDPANVERARAFWVEQRALAAGDALVEALA